MVQDITFDIIRINVNALLLIAGRHTGTTRHSPLKMSRESQDALDKCFTF